MSAQSRFMAYVRKTSGCWLWAGGVGATGYGRFHLEGKATSAHRAAYRLFVGPIPNGKNVCHKCDVRGCVRPSHLFVGSQLENIIDMVAKRRHAHGPSFAARVTPSRARGEKSGRAKLTNRQVASIRRSKQPLAVVAEKYKIHPNYVSALRNGHYRKANLS